MEPPEYRIPPTHAVYSSPKGYEPTQAAPPPVWYDIPSIPPPPPPEPKRRKHRWSIVGFIALLLCIVSVAVFAEWAFIHPETKATTRLSSPTVVHTSVPTLSSIPTAHIQPTGIPPAVPTVGTTVIVVVTTMPAPTSIPTTPPAPTDTPIPPPTPTDTPTAVPTDTPTPLVAPYTAEDVHRAFYQAGIQMGQSYWNTNWKGWNYTPEGGAIYWTDIQSGYTVEIATFATHNEAYSDAQQVGQGWASQTVNNCLLLNDGRMTAPQIAPYQQVMQTACT